MPQRVLEGILADIISLRYEVLRQTDKLISQINAELSSRQGKSIQWAPSIQAPIDIAESNTAPQTCPLYALGSLADHQTASTFSQINADLKKSHLDLGIHWDDGDYKVASSGSKPIPIFSDGMKRRTSRGFVEVSHNGDQHFQGTSKTQPTSSNVSEASLTLLQQMVVGTTNIKTSGIDNSDDSLKITGLKGLTTKNLRLLAEDVKTSSPSAQKRERKSKAMARPMSWTVGPSQSILKHSDTDSGSGSDSLSKMRKSRRSTATASKLSTEDAYPISSQPQTSPANCQDQIYDIVEVATPPYMSPPDSLKKNFPVSESVQSSGCQVVVNVEEKDETVSDSTEVKEEEKQSQDSVKKIKRVMSRSKRKLPPTLSRKNITLSWFTILFLVPAYDGKGRGLKFNDFNITDFQHVTFAHNGLHPRSYFISSWEFIISLFYLIFAWEIPFTASYSNDFPLTPATNLQLWSILIVIVYTLDIIVVQLTPEPSASNELCNLTEYESLRPILTSWISSNVRKRVPFDILATIPLELLVTSWERRSTLLFLHGIRFYRLPRILSTNAFYKKLQTATDAAIGLPICNIIPITVGMFYFLHFNACALYYFGSLKGFVGWSVFWPDVENATMWEFYSWTFYQAVGNMFPINFTPQTELEQIVAAFFIVTAAILYATFLGSISSTTMSINPSGRLYNQKIEELNDYVKWKNLSPEIEKKLFSYYEIKYRGKFFEEETLLNTVNDSLKQEIVLHNTRWLIEKVTFLRRSENDGRDEIFFSAIASKLHACYYTPGDFITEQGESAADMYFIVSGKCDVYVGDKKVVSLYDGAYFGEVALICKVLRTASVQAIMHSVLYRLTYQDFHGILEEFLDMKERIQKLAVEREIAAQVTTCNSKSVVFPETTMVKD